MTLPTRLTLALCSLVITGCAHKLESRPLSHEAATRGIRVVHEMPQKLPSELSKIEGTQYVLVFAESTTLALVDNLLPLPVSVTGPIAAAYHDHEAEQLRTTYARVDPQPIALEAFQGSPLLSQRDDAVRLMPLVYLVEDNQDVFRPTLVFRLEQGDWQGRYLYHLPTSYTEDQVLKASPVVLETLRRELAQGSRVLRQLIERDARGELVGDGRRVKYGSYHIVGSRISGVVSASIYTFADAQLLEEAPDHVILRSSGADGVGAREGSLAFGVHHFFRNQLHTYEVMPAK